MVHIKITDARGQALSRVFFFKYLENKISLLVVVVIAVAFSVILFEYNDQQQKKKILKTGISSCKHLKKKNFRTSSKLEKNIEFFTLTKIDTNHEK